MLQETVHQKKDVGTLQRGFYRIETAREVWDRVQITSRSRNYVRLLFLATERYRVRQGQRTYWRTRRFMRLQDLPIRLITIARKYTS